MSEPRVRRVAPGEDWLAVWLAAALMVLALGGVRPGLPGFQWTGASDLLASVLSVENLRRALVLGLLCLGVSGIGVYLMGGRLGRFLAGFPFIYALAWLAQVVAGQATVASWGLEYVLFALVAGLAVGQAFAVPAWLQEAVRTEFYIKIGLVVLGAGILFGEMIEAGLLGIAQALLVVIVVWLACFSLARRLRVDDEFAAMLATAVSICGVSAAIAACGAIQGDRKKLSYVTSLVLVVAAPMMVVMPWIARAVGMPEIVAGAWLGGTLDTSAAVVAAGEMVSPPARTAAVVVKLSQNVLIGLAAFLLTLWWTLGKGHARGGRASARVIWDRFPKFVLGFLAASFVFSFLLSESQVTATRSLLSGFRTVWFALAFVSIGLETRFTDLVTTEGGRPAVAFLGGQGINVVWTLILAYLFFGGVLFPVPRFN